jgi:PIN domain nuclease of toxin-antitoxin system
VEAVIYLDTHVTLWLYEAQTGLFPSSLRAVVEDNDLVVSPLVELELQYLFEVGKITQPGDEIVNRLEEEIGLRRCGLPFSVVVKTALDIHWTRDPFDRLIVAQAAARNLPLVTKDEIIRDNYAEAVWGDD